MENFSLIDGNFYAMDYGIFLKFMRNFFKKCLTNVKNVLPFDAP
jgi:hypothetical protein